MVGAMFIRRTQTRRTEDGNPYFSHRLVHAERLGSTVRQRTLLNLGRHFDIPQADWPLLCAPHQRCVERSGAAGGRLPACRGGGSATDRGAVDRTRRGRADRRTDRCAAGRCRLVAAGPPPQRRRGAGRPVGARATGPAGAADPVGRQRRPAQRGPPAPSSGVWPRPPRSARRTAGCSSAAVSGSCSASTSRPSVRCSSTAPRTCW